MTYEAEVQVLNKQNGNKIDATVIDYWRRNSEVSGINRITNDGIKRRMGIKEDTLNDFEEKRLPWYVHVKRADPIRWIDKITDWSERGILRK